MLKEFPHAIKTTKIKVIIENLNYEKFPEKVKIRGRGIYIPISRNTIPQNTQKIKTLMSFFLKRSMVGNSVIL